MPARPVLLVVLSSIAALGRLLVRRKRLEAVEQVGIALVIAASAGSLGPRGWLRGLGSYNRSIMANPPVAALARVPLFSGLSARELSAIAAAAHEREVPAGSVLTEQGGVGNEFFVVADGEVAVDVGGRDVRRLGQGDYLGEIALVLGSRRTATATASKPTRLYVLDEPAFTALLRRQPRIEDTILATVAERMRFR